MIYAFDSTTIRLYMHKSMDLRGSIPTFVLLTPGKVNDAKVMDKVPVESGSFFLMNKG